MPKFTQDFTYDSPLMSGEFRNGDEAPMQYAAIIEAAIAAGALPGKDDNGHANISAKKNSIKLEG